MNAATEFDLGPLTWVKGEIDLALQRAEEALGQYEAGADGTPPLKFCRTHVHQVHGALAIVGLDGITQVTESLESLLTAIEDGRQVSDEAAVAAVHQALAGIRLYLDELMAGEKAREQKYQQVEALEKKRNALLAAINKRGDMIATPSIPDILGGLDKSFSSDVWLTDLGFTLGLGERKGAPPAPGAAAATGGNKAGGRLDLRGAARNYAAVYQFVEKFSSQPGVIQVQVVETLRNRKPDDSSVSFVVEAQLANAPGKKP